MEEIVVSIDVGGTSYKAALVDAQGAIIPDTFVEMPSYSECERDIVITGFKNILSTMLQVYHTLISSKGDSKKNEKLHIRKIALDFPGPFDYDNGLSLMNHKFASIKGMSLFPIIREVFDDPYIEILFHHDLHACTYGAYLYDVAKGYSRVFCIAIGTGLGTGYLRDGAIIMRPGRQPMYPIFNKPYKDGMLEDYVANRGIVNEYRRQTGNQEPLDSRKIEYLALHEDDKAAIQAYRTMGMVLGKEIRPLLRELKIDCLIFGGQVSKGYSLFGPALEKELEALPDLHHIEIIKNITSVTIRGAAALSV